jgi:hypothetical protein
MTQASNLLRAAKALISDPANWTQDGVYVTAEGCMCAQGAINKAFRASDRDYEVSDQARDYPPEVLEAVDLLTHDKKQLDYPSYIDRICESGNRWAILVKLADQKDNLDPARWLLLGKHKARALTKRYAGVVPQLEEALENAAA